MNYDYINKSPAELSRWIGRMEQLAGIREYTLADGPGRGCRCVEVENGSGLRFTVLLDRGMDIGPASFKGVPLSFITQVGDCHPAYYEPAETGWMRTFGGGLLTGCGLDNVGAPSVYDGESLGLHGRLSHLPAEKCVCEELSEDGGLSLRVAGTVRQTRMFGENLYLRRNMTTRVGDNRIIINDLIENRGFRPSRMMLLYHINLGFPLVSPHASLSAADHPVTARDEVAEKGLTAWSQCQDPTPNWREQCFYHHLPADDDGMARMTLNNPDLGLSFEVAFDKASLPLLTQWKQMGEGEYVIGLEPANCHVEGAAKEAERSNLKTLSPGEKYRTKVVLTVEEIR